MNINEDEDSEYSRNLMVTLVRIEAKARNLDIASVPDSVIEAFSARDMKVGEILEELA